MTIPAFLSEFIRTVIIMTLSGGVLTLLLFIIKPIIRHRLPKSSQYIFWLTALAAFLIPVSKIVVLPEIVSDIAPIHNIVERNVISTAEAQDRPINTPNLTAPVITYFSATIEQESLPAEELPFITQIISVFMIIYPFVFAFVLLYNLTGYAYFIKKLRRNYFAPHSFELDTLYALTNGKYTPRLMVSDYATTPMLIGIFKPVIVLPNREYTTEQLHSILLHELTHFKRLDIAVKWLSLLSCALHWFNPIMWAAKREIDRICELSCDEAVIRNMDRYEKQQYGETLISVASNKKIPPPVLSTTMCEEKRALKERLTAIMKSKKHTKLAILISAVILLTVILTACAVGAGSINQNNTEPEQQTVITPTEPEPTQQTENLTEPEPTQQTVNLTEPEPTQQTVNLTEPEPQTVEDEISPTRDGILHKFETLGFSVVFPASWENKYSLVQRSVEMDGGTVELADIYHIYSNVTLVTLGKAVGEHYTEDNPPFMAGASILMAQTGGYTYFANFPSDVGYDYSEPLIDSTIEYLELSADWDFLTDSFRLLD